MRADEVQKVELYLKQKLSPNLKLVTRPKTTDSAELYLDDEFLGLIYVITDEGETSYQLQMSILQEDLDDLA